METILTLQNNKTADMLVYQTNPVRVQFLSYVNTFFRSNKFAWLLDTGVNINTLKKPVHAGLFFPAVF